MARHHSTSFTSLRGLLLGGGIPGRSLRLERSHSELMKACVGTDLAHNYKNDFQTKGTDSK